MSQQQISAYKFVRLGMNIEYLRGVASVSMIPDKGLARYPRLIENLPSNRYRVMSVVETLRSLFIQLEELSLEQTLAEAQQLLPLLQQMETYLAENPDPTTAFMNDSFADRLVFYVQELHLCLKAEASSMTA